MTARRILKSGIVAGLGCGDMLRLSPGFVLDAIDAKTRREEALYRLKRADDGG